MSKLTCPYCNRTFDLDMVEMAELFHERAELAARLGPCWAIANEYVDCFRQTPGGKITLKRRVALLTEVVKLWEKCEFEYDGKRYRTDPARIRAGLNTVCTLGKTALQNHNYLKKVLTGNAERVSAEGMTAKEERTREESRQRDLIKRHEEAEGTMTAEEWKRRRGIETLAGMVGKKME